MKNVLEESLYKKQQPQFERIEEQAIAFSANYCGTTIIRDSIFNVTSNYARKKGFPLEILRYPFKDIELWAFTFVKKGTVFLCVNSELALCKQFFAAGHELYHIHCFAEDSNPEVIERGSLLDSQTADEAAASQEDLEANAFAGLLLMPGYSINEQMKINGISPKNVSVNDILTLMDLFALPYKAIVLRLVENQNITETKARELLKNDASYIAERIALTGKAKQWHQNSSQLLYLGSLLDNIAYNSNYEFLTQSREDSDRKYIRDLIEELNCSAEGGVYD